LQYLPRALAHFNNRENARREEKDQKQNERLKRAYEAYRQEAIERIRSSISPEEFSAMESSIRAELAAENTLPAMIGVGVSIRLDAQLEKRASVLPYEEWKNQRLRLSKGQTA
jgi:hypothetical protein